MSSALLLESVNALVACKDLDELASSAALLARRLLEVPSAVVVLRTSEREFASPVASSCAELGPWASGLLAACPRRSSSGALRAAGIQPSSGELHGVLAVSLADSITSETVTSESLPALADLIASCGAQLVGRAQADRNLQDTRALVARGLHDICTPLNSLRLGMHLLVPALTTKDLAVAQRAQRAVDRMAALVTSMAETIGGSSTNGQSSVSAHPAASTTQH